MFASTVLPALLEAQYNQLKCTGREIGYTYTPLELQFGQRTAKLQYTAEYTLNHGICEVFAAALALGHLLSALAAFP